MSIFPGSCCVESNRTGARTQAVLQAQQQEAFSVKKPGPRTLKSRIASSAGPRSTALDLPAFPSSPARPPSAHLPTFPT